MTQVPEHLAAAVLHAEAAGISGSIWWLIVALIVGIFTSPVAAAWYTSRRIARQGAQDSDERKTIAKQQKRYAQETQEVLLQLTDSRILEALRRELAASRGSIALIEENIRLKQDSGVPISLETVHVRDALQIYIGELAEEINRRQNLLRIMGDFMGARPTSAEATPTVEPQPAP